MPNRTEIAARTRTRKKRGPCYRYKSFGVQAALAALTAQRQTSFESFVVSPHHENHPTGDAAPRVADMPPVTKLLQPDTISPSPLTRAVVPKHRHPVALLARNAHNVQSCYGERPKVAIPIGHFQYKNVRPRTFSLYATLHPQEHQHWGATLQLPPPCADAWTYVRIMWLGPSCPYGAFESSPWEVSFSSAAFPSCSV